MLDASRRIFAVVAAALVAVATVAQAGCGVLHCVEREVVAAERAVPPCHGGGDSGDAGSSHAPGEGNGSCCVVMPLEQAAPAPSISFHATHVALGPDLRLVVGSGWTTHAPIPAETGPPLRGRTAASIPLRI